MSSSAATTSPTTAFDIRQLDHDRVLSMADKHLRVDPVTITSFHAERSAGGSHDYYSEADYFWPNPNNPDGPYVNRDGISNPNNFNEHRNALIRMSIAVPALAAAYLLMRDQKYSHHAAKHLVAWFVDDNTRMNPSLLYSQAIHGVCTGRSYGLIDTLHLVEVSKAISILTAHSQLGPADSIGIYGWFTQYLKWMTIHLYGITEGKAKNNHATCYWLQVASFATLVGAGDQFNESRRRFKEQLLPQMAPDGSFPQELHRTKPFGYSLFNLDQMTSLCHVISADDQNFWTFAITSGQTLHQAAEYMYPYAKDKSTWPFKPDVMYFQNWPVRSPAWLFAGLAYDEQKYIDLWKTLDPSPTVPEVLRNLPIRQPVLWVEEA
jgi:Alginate lyase